uniref:RRM domain-containing protein n=1 Tax=Anopheles stephensi TaxID=30069 RepID=A0A182YB61_ANOST
MNPNEVVYISNIPKQTSLAELHSLLKSSGNVVGSTFMRENRNDCRTKIAFVLFENEAQAAEACGLDQTLFQSHRLSVMLSNDDRKFLAGYTIVIHNTSSDTSEEDLFEACCRYGNVETVQIPTNHYAFVSFSERSAAHAAHRKLNNSMLNQHQVSVKVLDEDVRVRLEDLDSYKTPRVYNELLRAKQQYFDNQEPMRHDPQQNLMDDRDDDFQDHHQQQHQYNDNLDDDSMGQYNRNENCDDFSPAPGLQDYEEDYSPLLVYRRDVRFGKLRFQTENNTAVKVENIPREVYDEDVVIYFQKFGPILSIERGICLNALFSKIYTITYQNEESQQRALNCFCRQVVLSDITCTIFTMIPGEALHPVKNQSVLINFVPNYVMYDEIVQAFSDIGNVLYVEKKVRNNGPTIVHFTHPINMNDACQIDSITDINVTIVPVSQKDFMIFTTNMPVYFRAAKGRMNGTPKGNYLQEIEAKEEQEKKDNIIFKTGFDPHYCNPNPKKYNFEVVVYNCPKAAKLSTLKGYFNRAGAVRALRKEPSKFDSNTWKVFVSFANYLEAYRAVRLKGKFNGDFIFKHIAAESPRLDCMEAIMVTVVPGLKDVLKQKGKQKIFRFNLSSGANTGADDDTKDYRGRVLLSDMFGQKEPKDMDSKAVLPIPPPKAPKPPGAPRTEPLTVEIINKPCDTPKPSTSSVPPPVDIKEEDLRNVIVEKRSIKSECLDQLNSLEEMERYIKQKEQDIQRRLQQLEKDEANVTALLPSTSTKRAKSSEEKAKEPTSARTEPPSGSRANASSSRRTSSPTLPLIEPSSSSSSHQRISNHTTTVGVSIPTYSSSDSLRLSDQMRSVSPSDRLAHERYMQIRVEKIAITQELDSLRQRFDYRKGSRVDALRDLLAGLNREQREIQIQLEAKRRFRMPDDANYAGSSETPQQTILIALVPIDRAAISISFAVPPQCTVFSITLKITDFRKVATLTITDLWKIGTLPIKELGKIGTLSIKELGKIGTFPIKELGKVGPFSLTTHKVANSITTLERVMYNIGRYNHKHVKHSVYVGNVSSQVSQREIEEIFARFGRLADVDFDRFKWYGEVYFDYTNREHAFKALEMNNVKIAGRRLRVAFNSDKPSIREGYSLYLSLRQPTDEQTIYRTYESYGEIDFIWYPENQLIGTISFRRTEDANDALAVYKLIDGTPIKSRPFKDRVNNVA